MRATYGADRKEKMFCQVTTKACLGSKELNPENVKSEVEYREVPMKEAAVKSLGTMKKRHRGRHLAAGRRGEPKEQTRGDCGSRRNMVTSCRKVSRRAIVERRKKNIFRKIRTQGNCGPRKELAADGRRMNQSTKVAWCRGYDCKRYDQDNAVQETRKETLEGSGMQQWHKGPRPKIADKAASE
jgi:hypothetical protein